MKSIQNRWQRKKEEKRQENDKQNEPNRTKHTYKQKYKQNKHTNKQTNKQTNKTKQKQKRGRGLGGGGKGNKATCLNHIFIFFSSRDFRSTRKQEMQWFRGPGCHENLSLSLFFLLLICIPEATFYRRQADDAWARCAETCWVLAAVKTSTIRPNTRPPLYPAPRQPSQGSMVIFVRWMPGFKGLTTK